MKLSKKAKQGLEDAVKEITILIGKGLSAQQALREVGIKNMMDAYYFMEYLRETNNHKLFNLFNLFKKIK